MLAGGMFLFFQEANRKSEISKREMLERGVELLDKQEGRKMASYFWPMNLLGDSNRELLNYAKYFQRNHVVETLEKRK